MTENTTRLAATSTASMMSTFWSIVLEERVRQGVSANLLTVDDANQFHELSVRELALATISTNVILNVERGTLIFISPDESFNFHEIDGFPIQTNQLSVGQAIVGGALIVGTLIGDVVFPDYTAITTTTNDEEPFTMVSVVKMLQVERPVKNPTEKGEPE